MDNQVINTQVVEGLHRWKAESPVPDQGSILGVRETESSGKDLKRRPRNEAELGTREEADVEEFWR